MLKRSAKALLRERLRRAVARREGARGVAAVVEAFFAELRDPGSALWQRQLPQQLQVGFAVPEQEALSMRPELDEAARAEWRAWLAARVGVTAAGELQLRVKFMPSLAWLQAQSLANRARRAPAEQFEPLVQQAAEQCDGLRRTDPSNQEALAMSQALREVLLVLRTPPGAQFWFFKSEAEPGSGA